MARSSLIIEMSSDEARLLRGMQKVIQKESERDTKLKQTATAADKAANKQQKFSRKGSQFARTQAQSLKNLIVQYVGVQAVIQTVTQALNSQAQAAKDAAAANKDAVQGFGKLAQLPNFERNAEAAEKIFLSGATKTLDRAADLQFALVSAGLQKDRKLFQDIGATGLIGDVPGTILSIKRVQSAFEGQSGLSAREVLSKTFAASEFAPAGVGELLSASSRAGATAGKLGIKDEDVLAATTLISQTKGADVAGTRLDAFFRSLIKQGGFEGQSVSEIVSNIQSRKLSDQDLQKFFGSAEAFEAFNLLSSREGAFGEIRSKIAAAENKNLTSKKVAQLSRRLATRVDIRDRQTEARELLLNLDEGLAEQLSDAQTRDLTAGRSRVLKGIIEVGDKTTRMLVGAKTQLQIKSKISGLSEDIQTDLDLLNRNEQAREARILRNSANAARIGGDGASTDARRERTALLPAPQVDQPGRVRIPAPQVDQPGRVRIPAPQVDQPGRVRIPAPQVDQPGRLDAAATKQQQAADRMGDAAELFAGAARQLSGDGATTALRREAATTQE